MRNRLIEDPPVTDVQQEEDKAKMLLGAKLFVCHCHLLILNSNECNSSELYNLHLYKLAKLKWLNNVLRRKNKVIICCLNFT